MNDFIAGLAIGICVTVLVALWIGDNKDESWREQVTMHGCGGYYLDANNERQWNWKGSK